MDNWQDQLKDMVNKGFDIESAVEKMKQSALEQQVKAVQERSCKGCLYENKMGDEKVICLSCARWFGDDSFKDRFVWKESTSTNTGNKRSEILDTAKNMVNGSRQQDYGDPEDNFALIAQLWSVYLDYELCAEDVAMMMILLKVARASGNYCKDNYIDIAGYAACAGAIAERSNNGH